MKRHYYRTTVTIHVYSDHHIECTNVEDLGFLLNNGDMYPWEFIGPEEEELTPQEMAEELNDCGLEPNLLKLSDEGEEL